MATLNPLSRVAPPPLPAAHGGPCPPTTYDNPPLLTMDPSPSIPVLVTLHPSQRRPPYDGFGGGPLDPAAGGGQIQRRVVGSRWREAGCDGWRPYPSSDYGDYGGVGVCGHGWAQPACHEFFYFLCLINQGGPKMKKIPTS